MSEFGDIKLTEKPQDSLLRIESFNDVKVWLQRDLEQRGAIKSGGAIGMFVLWRDPVNMFMALLRLKEWCLNARPSRLLKWSIAFLYRRSQLKLGFSIPPNTFGPGLAIVHYGPIVVNGNARIGENCRIHVCVNIGGAGGLVSQEIAKELAPRLGKNIYIAPGVKIYGPVYIADGCAIGANAVVNRSFETPNISIAGVPAEQISKKGSTGLILKAEI